MVSFAILRHPLPFWSRHLILGKLANDLQFQFLDNKKTLNHHSSRLGWRLATGEVLGSNPDKGDNLLISDY